MKIGIIGAGFIGGTLTRRLTSLGHEVQVANSRDPETLAELASETGATAVWAADAAKDADLLGRAALALGTEYAAGVYDELLKRHAFHVPPKLVEQRPGDFPFIVASPQAPKHSASLSVNAPSGVVSLKPMPSAFLRCCAATLAPCSAHGRLVQIAILCRPTGFTSYIV